MTAISVLGTGYVGLVTGACFAELGNQVTCVDVDAERIDSLVQGESPFFEPGLEELVRRHLDTGRLRFSTSYADAVRDAAFIFLCLPTPPRTDGAADVTVLRAAVETLAALLEPPYPTIVNKSTAPVGTCTGLHRLLARVSRPLHAAPVVANPEFLREGTAIADFMHPDRVVIGAHSAAAAERVREIYAPLGSPVLVTDLNTAEMIKYGANAFLATKISFINELANICEQVDADVMQVAAGMGLDPRIGPAFLRPGVGYGGSCFPKDVLALAHLAASHGVQPRLLRSVMEVNADQFKRVLDKLRDHLGSLDGAVVAVWGIAFKPNTDDIRAAPAIEIMQLLQQEGAHVRAYDPVAMPKAATVLPRVTMCRDPYEAAAGADAILLLTEWSEFKAADLDRIAAAMRTQLLIDGRNAIEPVKAEEAGLRYVGVGRAAQSERCVRARLRVLEGMRRAG